ncbi:MAG: PQQ-dependent sugar dehydrogenase [Gammaproteobacteria bacterium]|nr:PQQ-dependent sugar dehydrogenase [Gammaproteobacteria bacterium]MDP2141840.1 PQQ-dependent sugar dehydrogenase [Gammaproteobacteria bacterium]MDP2348331.1 PQQ-dependent sugar dehydrogenase [Gammaproteobacteria bacterium]
MRDSTSCLTAVLLAVFLAATTANAQTQPGFRLEKVAEGIAIPWGMTWLPNGDMLVTNRGGELYRVRDGQISAPLGGVPAVHVNGQGGLLDIMAHPNYVSNGWLYITYSSPEGGGEGSHTAIMRARLEGNSLVEQQILYKGDENSGSGAHYGSRIAFDREGYLYFSIGDRGAHFENAQQLDRDGGKIYRLHDDGRIPADNPFISTPGAKSAVYSYGHRNPQGLTVHPTTGRIWEHEHGPMGGDEINLIQAGKNYGWPIIGYGINYNGQPLAEATSREGFEPPLFYWDPSIAPSGIAFITSDNYGPGLKGHLLVGSLKFQHIVYMVLDGDRVAEHAPVFQDIGRVRNIKQGADGYIYVATEGNGIVRILPE